MQGFLELWGEGETWEELEASINAFSEEVKQPWLQPNLSMKVGRSLIASAWPAPCMHSEFLLCIRIPRLKAKLIVPQVVIDGWGRIINKQEQSEYHERLEFIPFQA